MADPSQEFVALRKAISDAYYDARNAGRTMEQAADDAAAKCEGILAERLAATRCQCCQGRCTCGGADLGPDKRTRAGLRGTDTPHDGG